MRRQLSWLIAVPIAVVGSLAGHSVGYRAVVPDAHERAHVLASSGHGYLEYSPLLVSVCLALVALGFLALLLGAVRGHEAARGKRQIVLVAALAPMAFVLQELLERYAHEGRVHWGLLVSAPFLFGLATQIPFALLAAAVAFALASAAQRVAQVIRGSHRRQPRVAANTFLSWLSVDAPVQRVLARGYAGRGPPLLA